MMASKVGPRTVSLHRKGMYARIEVAEDRDAIGDADLLRYFRRGDQGALDVLVERHRDALFRFCYHLTGNREDAEDVCQETLARAMTRVGSLQSDSAFRSWLFSIARNLSIDTHRRKKRTVTMPDDEAMPIQLFTEEPHDHVEVEEEHQTVVEAMGKLAHSHQRVLVLREVEGMSYAAIAETLDVSQSAVETLLFRARRRLKEEYHKSAAPALALLAGIRELIFKAGGPAVGGTLAKLAATAAVVGSMAVTVPHTHFTFPQVPSGAAGRSHGALGVTRHTTASHSVTVARHYTSSALPPSVFGPNVSTRSEVATRAAGTGTFSVTKAAEHSNHIGRRSASSKSKQLRKAAPTHAAGSGVQHGTTSLPPAAPAPSAGKIPVSAPVAPAAAPTAAHVKWVPAVVERPSTPVPPAPTSVPATVQPTAAPVPTSAPAPIADVAVQSSTHGHEGKAGKPAAIVPDAAPAFARAGSAPGTAPTAWVSPPSQASAPPASSSQGPSTTNLPPGQAKKDEGQGSTGNPGKGHHK